jgi:uncharacterized membrane protein required for colicin V production
MVWIDIIAVLILIFSFAGGLKEGAIRSLLSLISIIITIPITGITYYYMASVFSFMGNSNWSNFLGFFSTFIIISIIFGILLWLPRRFFEKFWNGGCIFSFLGGLFSMIGAAISMALLTIVVNAFPIFDWLQFALNSSTIITWLTGTMSFIQWMLPVIYKTPQFIALIK